MNPKSFPKRLDSKTSCLRITVPENLDLALEGLIRKVLREQPKTDDIYAFAANYFETLLRIRDKAGVEYTATQLCPHHNDEEAHEMIVLAGIFPRQVPGRVQGKGPAPFKTEKETHIVEPERGAKISKETLKDSNSGVETKQATPDLIKKLPLFSQNQGLNGEETTDSGSNNGTETVKEGGGDEEEDPTSDPIKEFVEKELLKERNSKEQVAEGEGPAPSESGSPTPREGENEKAEGGAPLVSIADEKKGADGRNNRGVTDVVIGVIHAEGKRKIDPETRESDEKGVEAGDEEGKIECAGQPEQEGERPLQEAPQKKKKENEELSSKSRAEEESENKMDSAPEAEAEGVKAPLSPLPPCPGGAEKPAKELEPEVSPGLKGREVSQTQSAISSEAASSKETRIAEVSPTSEDKSETDAQTNTARPITTNEESPETSSLVKNSCDSNPVENVGARAAENDESQKSVGKEATDKATESIARSEREVQDPIIGPTERRINDSETEGSRERAKKVQEVKEGGAFFEEDLHRMKGEESKEGKNPAAKAEDPSKPYLKSTEEGAKPTSMRAVEAKHAVGQPKTRAEDLFEPSDEGTEFSGKFDPGMKAGGSEILEPEQLSNSHVTESDKEPELKRGDEERKEGEDKKLSNEEAKTKDRSLVERRESLSNRTSPEGEFPLQKVEDFHCAAEASTDAKQEVPRDGSSPTDGARRLTERGETSEIIGRETESAELQEYKTEDALAAENELASLATEELCSVVDIHHLRDGGNQDEPEPTKPRPENTPEERSDPEPESSPSASLSPTAQNGEKRGEKPNFHRESEAQDAARGKVESEEPPNSRPVQEPVKSETHKKFDSSEGMPHETREGFDPSAKGKQIIIVEEPDTTSENPEESSPSGEIQIKTIQTHYYDALRVPETVTREYRVHEVIPPRIVGLMSASTPPPSTSYEMRESPGYKEQSGRLTDDNAVPPTPKTSPTSDGYLSPYAEAAEVQSDVERADSLLAVDGSDYDAQASDFDDPPRPATPTSDVSLNLAEFSSREASKTFLTNEKRFSSLGKEEIRFVTPTTEETGKGEPEVRVSESGQGIDEMVLPSIAAVHSASRALEETETVKEDRRRPVESSEDSPALSDGSTADGESPNDSASEKPVAEPRSRCEDDSGPDASQPPSGIKPEQAEDFQRRTATRVESAKESFPSLQKTQERNVPESRLEEFRAESGSDAQPLDRRSTEWTPAAEASETETDSATSSATTVAKRVDSPRRDFTSARSLDLGKRNPLLRTRSLSAHRHGVADFEVWSTIEKELEEAATKIQSKFRGYKTRKKLRREIAVQISTEESSERSTPVEANDADDHPRATGEFHDGIVLAEHPR